jgi:hypothetical protein
MDVNRAERIADVLKSTKSLRESVKKPGSATTSPTLLQPNIAGAPNVVPPAVEGTGFIRILMYIIAGLLIIGLVLLAVDQWITPIFQRTPGGAGYIPIPGQDQSELFWATLKDIDNITVGSQPTPAPLVGYKPMVPLSTNALEGQTNYSITMDVYIKDEFIQDIGNEQDRRVFFMLGQSPSTPTLTAWIANDKNTAYITAYDNNGLQESVEFENVPIKKPFRIGIVKTPFAMEGYINGLLVKTRQIRSANIIPKTGDKIFSPANIIVNGKTLSQNILVLKMRLFGYSVSTSEMRGRMGDLATVDDFIPPEKSKYNILEWTY